MDAEPADLYVLLDGSHVPVTDCMVDQGGVRRHRASLSPVRLTDDGKPMIVDAGNGAALPAVSAVADEAVTEAPWETTQAIEPAA